MSGKEEAKFSKNALFLKKSWVTRKKMPA